MAQSLNQRLLRLRKLKKAAEEAGRKYKAAGAEHKALQGQVLHQIDAMLDKLGSDERDFSIKFGGSLFSKVEKIKGQIEDRKPYVRWCLENDEGVQDFLTELDALTDGSPEFRELFYVTIMNTDMVEYKEKGDVMNQQAREHVDNGTPLPPGLTFRPDPYISIKAA